VRREVVLQGETSRKGTRGGEGKTQSAPSTREGGALVRRKEGGLFRGEEVKKRKLSILT